MSADTHHKEASQKLYYGVFTALLVLTVLTVGMYQIHLGAMNLVVAIVIATMKAGLVVWFFMHMSHEKKFNAAVFLSSLLFGAIFLAYTLNDTEHREEASVYNGSVVDPVTGARAYGSPQELVDAADSERQ